MSLALYASADVLQNSFRQPPSAAKPWTFLFVQNGNWTTEGITADLEALARAGLGGVMVMEHVDAPAGPVKYLTPQWQDIYRHLFRESKRLGLGVKLAASPGCNIGGGPWIGVESSMQKLVWTTTGVSGGQTFSGVVPQPNGYQNYYRDVALYAYPTALAQSRIPAHAAKSLRAMIQLPPVSGRIPALDTGMVLPLDRIVDLTGRLDASGRLTWQAPPGEWTVLRIGHTSTGSFCYTGPKGSLGFECDKFSRDAFNMHFKGMIQPMVDAIGKEYVGTTMAGWEVDSWEAGPEAWTPAFREEFRKRRGYDMQPWMPVLANVVVDSLARSERFLWDFRMTANEMVCDNYYGELSKRLNQQGMTLESETYHFGPFNDLSCGSRVDVPMGTFWQAPKFNALGSCWVMASVGHVFGKPVITSEAFTASASERWLAHPGTMKEIADCAFGAGINHLTFHRTVAQPWVTPARLPGMTYGPWGVHYDRTQTWWEHSRPWNDYLTRCSHLLQQGISVADICFLVPENSPQAMTWINTTERPGYAFDLTPSEGVLTRMSVKDGRIVLPDGGGYRMLVLPNAQTMTPKLLEKLRDLIAAGATVVGNPPLTSPSLEDYPACDRRIAELTREIWGTKPVPQEPTERHCGKGTIICGRTLTPSSALDFGLHGAFEWANWIWPAKASAEAPVPTGAYYFRKVMDIDGEIESAKLAFGVEFVGRKRGTPKSTVKISAEGWVNGTNVMPKETRHAGLTPHVFNATPALKPGRNLVSVAIELNGEVPTMGWAATLTVKLKDGRLLTLVSDQSWVTAPRVEANWTTQLEPLSGWTQAANLGPLVGTADQLRFPGEALPYFTMFQKDMKVPGELLAKMGVPPDFACEGPKADLRPRYAHRRIGDTDVYFVANKTSGTHDFSCLFRVTGKPAQFWRPETGKVEPVAVATETDGRTRIPIRLEAYESVFVVFSPRPVAPTAPAAASDRNWHEITPVQTLTGTWEVRFDPQWGGPAQPVVFSKLDDWSKRSEPGIKYYSGRAVYRKQFTVAAADYRPGLLLDLGKVEVSAAVRLNGQPVGILWKSPYRIDLGTILKPGENELEIEVANLWVNRMIGDEQLPEDSERKKGEWGPGMRTLTRWPKWLLEGKPSPTGRYTFASTRMWTKDEPLVKSGLLGPVRLLSVKSATLHEAN